MYWYSLEYYAEEFYKPCLYLRACKSFESVKIMGLEAW
jgi:hypothetical protein